MEAEASDILRDAVKDEGRPVDGLGTRIAQRFGGIGLKPGEVLERPDFGEQKPLRPVIVLDTHVVSALDHGKTIVQA